MSESTTSSFSGISELLPLVLGYLAKGTLLTGGLALFQNLRGKVKSALFVSLLQTFFFAFVLFLIDYILPSYLPTGLLSTGPVETPSVVSDQQTPTPAI